MSKVHPRRLQAVFKEMSSSKRPQDGLEILITRHAHDCGDQENNRYDSDNPGNKCSSTERSTRRATVVNVVVDTRGARIEDKVTSSHSWPNSKAKIVASSYSLQNASHSCRNDPPDHDGTANEPINQQRAMGSESGADSREWKMVTNDLTLLGMGRQY